MHDEPNQRAERADAAPVERVVLALLLDPRSHGPWTAQELARELGDEVAAVDAVASLHAAGLVHLCHQLVFPSRTAARFLELEESG